MEKKRYGVLAAIVAVLAVIVVLGISYAAFSQQLEIDGSATVNKSSWKIKFVDLEKAVTTGTAKEVTSPSIETGDTKVGNFAVTLTTPGDTVSYKVKVKNEGTFNATLSSKNVPKPTCNGTGANEATDASNVCKYLEYTLTYANGDQINTGDSLNVGESKELLLKLVYKDDITAQELPKDDVTITNLQVTLVYAQAPTTFD